MGEQERVTLAEALAPLVSAADVHRYRFAAAMCGSARVLDLGSGTGHGARILGDAGASVTAVDTGEALECLRRSPPDAFDAIVAFGVLEHLSDPAAALEALATHAEAGVKLILSVPNRLAFDEDESPHPTGFDRDEAMAAFGRFDDVTVLYQHFAEGSIIQGEEASDVEAELVLPERAEPEYASHFIACVNFGSSPELAAAGARLHLAVAANLNRIMLSLSRALREQHRINVRLARERLGVEDSAAAARMHAGVQGEEVAAAVRQALDKPRYRLVDGVRARLERLPLLNRLIRLAGRVMSR